MMNTRSFFIILACLTLNSIFVQAEELQSDRTAQRVTADPQIFEALLPHFQYKQEPGPMDWLAHHKESLQSFIDYRQMSPSLPDQKRRYLDIVILGETSEVEEIICQKTAQFLEVYFQMPVRIVDDANWKNMPEWIERRNPLSGSRQVLSTFILEDILMPRLADDAFGLIALTAMDLWPGENWNYVFGQASIVDRVGVWSIARMGKPKESEEERQKTLLRSIKTASHETGHMFSITHEIIFEGNMNGYNHLGEADRRPLMLAPISLKKLQWAIGFDIEKRYRELHQLLASYGFDDLAKQYLELAEIVAEISSTSR